MKDVNVWILLGVIVAGHTSPRAQPVSKPLPDDGEPAKTDDAPARSGGDEPLVTDDSDKPWSREVSLETRSAAREIFRKGNDLANRLLFARAAEEYRVALTKWKHPAFYYNLGRAQIALGQEVEARASLEQALAHGQGPFSMEEFLEAQRQLQEVTRQLGRIRVTCRTPGAEVTLDGVRLFAAPGSHEAWVKAKDHEITAKKPGYLSEARRVTLALGQLQDVDLSLVTLTQATDASRRWAAWKPWAVVATGGAIAAAGGVLHAFSARNFNAYDDKFLQLGCASPPPSEMPSAPGCRTAQIPSGTADLLILARRQQTMAVGAYIVGGSIIATGVVLLYLNQPQSSEQETARSSARSATIVPTISADMFGVLVNVNH